MEAIVHNSEPIFDNIFGGTSIHLLGYFGALTHDFHIVWMGGFPSTILW